MNELPKADGKDTGGGGVGEVSFQVVDHYQPPKGVSTSTAAPSHSAAVATAAAAAAVTTQAPTSASKPPFIPPGINLNSPTPRGASRQTPMNRSSPKPFCPNRRNSPRSAPSAAKPPSQQVTGVDVDKFRVEMEEILRQMASMMEVASEARCSAGNRKRNEDVFRGMEEAEIKRRETRVNKVAVRI